MILDVHVTTRCNLRCRHCYLKGLKAEDRRDMDLDLFAELLIDASLHSVKTFILSGGEPLYHRNIDEVLDAYRLYYGGLAMATNGTLIPEYIDLFSSEDRGIQISLDGDKDFHDWLRGEGTYDAVIQGIEELRERGITPSIAFTVARENLHCVEHVIDLCHRYGIRHVNVNMYMPLTDSELTPLTLRQFFEVRERFRAAGIRVSEPCYLKRCIAGVGVLSILPNGEVWDCSRSRIRLSREFAEMALSGRARLERESCLKTKPNNLFDYLRKELPPVSSPDALLYVDTFKRYDVRELEELESELRERIRKMGGTALFSGTLNCLFILDVLDDAVAYVNDKFLPETAEFIRSVCRDHNIELHEGTCEGRDRCDYLAFLSKIERPVIGCWTACNSDERNGNVIEAFRGIDGRKLDKMLIYWYRRKFGELPKWWHFFMCDLACKDGITEKKLRILKELFGG